MARHNDNDGGSLFPKEAAQAQGPVECLGMTFPNDEKRREHFLNILREKLKDPEFRKIEGFPIGADEDILALSDPPYYTACPNPWLADFIKKWEKEKPRINTNEHKLKNDSCELVSISGSNSYHREPFAADVSEGKTDPLYKAHSYHTKVPYKAIVPAILHYTEPGDVVLDGFAGSGMTGVAAQMCGNPGSTLKGEVEAARAKTGLPPPKWGARRAVLADLAPAATFIAANFNLPFDVEAFHAAGAELLKELEQELGWMYQTRHKDGRTGRIEYTIWSEVFTCQECSGEVVFLDEALDDETQRVKKTFPCPKCKVELTRQKIDRLYESRFDPVLSKIIKAPKRTPAIICYSMGKETFEKEPDKDDLKLLEKIAALPWPSEVPTTEIPYMHMTHERARMDTVGVTHLHHFFTPRAAHALATLWRKAQRNADPRLRNMLVFFVEQSIWGMSILNRYGPLHYSQVNRYLTGVYYVASQIAEVSPWYSLGGRLSRMEKAFGSNFAVDNQVVVTTGSTTRLPLQDAAFDYVFTDPPFGENIYYADLNFLVESWHRVLSNAVPEAIVDKAKKKDMPQYQDLMRACFAEYYRVLKQGRWMTLVFHNSHNAVWNAIQEGLQAAGFVVADVRTLDKQQGSYRQVTSAAVKQDLVISAYKPNGGLEQRFKLEAGKEEGAWDFLRTHLRQLPVFVAKSGRVEVIAERQNYVLFDRMVAFHVQRGVLVPLSTTEFYSGLNDRFSERDGMYFLTEQAAEYDRKRASAEQVVLPDLFVTDESSAIRWLQRELKEKPQTLQDLTPKFMQELKVWAKFEKPLELRELLQHNFLCCDGKDDVPPSIHAYLSSNWPELRKKAKDDPALRAKAKDRWYVPDPNKVGDLEKLREKSLMKEFEEYRASTQKRLKVFRLEAVRTGFKKAWQERDYDTIIAVARKIPEDVLQEDSKLLMWYDQAMTRSGEE